MTNIPGNDVALGNEMIAYDSPLALELDGIRINKDYPPHHSPILVFEQQGGRVKNCSRNRIMALFAACQNE